MPNGNEEDRRGAGVEADLDRLTRKVADLESRVHALEARSTPKPAQRRDAQPGLAAVNRIGAITLAIGIIFFFKYAVDNRWIGPGTRIALGLTAGAALIIAADHLRNQVIFAQGVAGCGLATLYITVYAAFAWYHFISEPLAAAALVAVSAIAVALSLRYRHPAIAGLGFSSAILTPVLLGGASSVIASYLGLIDCACLLIATRRKWPPLAAVIAAETIAASFYLARDWFPILTLALGALHLLTSFRATGNAFLVTGLLRLVIIETDHLTSPASRSAAESEAGSIFLALYGIAALAWGISRRNLLARNVGLALIGLVIAKLYLWDVWFLDRLYRMSAFGALGILLLAASWLYSRARVQ